ncbi:MAG: YdbL family protein [Steroidobacteraceae bacterium]
MLRYLPLKLAAACALLSACVTINVYFPAAAAEKAADRIIEDVWGESAQPAQPKADDKRGSIGAPVQGVLLAAAEGALNLLIAPAHAQADLNIATPAVRQLTQSMEARHAQLKKYYDSGAVGLTADGLVELRDLNVVPLPERNAARKLVSDENADRANLYREIAAANGHPEWESDIRSTFAQRWIDRASPGWYYKDSSGAWKQK